MICGARLYFLACALSDGLGQDASVSDHKAAVATQAAINIQDTILPNLPNLDVVLAASSNLGATFQATLPTFLITFPATSTASQNRLVCGATLPALVAVVTALDTSSATGATQGNVGSGTLVSSGDIHILALSSVSFCCM